MIGKQRWVFKNSRGRGRRGMKALLGLKNQCVGGSRTKNFVEVNQRNEG
jgi:hypothetical protein